MRFQSTFEKLFQGTHQPLFAACLVLLRISIGLGCIWLVASPSSLELAGLAQVFGWLLGTLFILGLLIRPAALGLLAMLWAVGLGSAVLAPAEWWPLYAIATCLLGLLVAGGAGHVLGLDGLIFSNIRRANFLSKFLFG